MPPRKVFRHRIVCDTETNGLDRGLHIPIEIAWANLDTGESGWFIPAYNVAQMLDNAEDRALEINGYHTRLAQLEQDAGFGTMRLARQLKGNTLAGATPAFDDVMLRKVFGEQLWHHRLLDLGSLACGVLGLDEVLGLDKLCKILQIGAYPDHTAAGDVEVTVKCFTKLMWLRTQLSPIQAAA